MPPRDDDAIGALTGAEGMMNIGELAGGIGMLQSYLASIKEEPATPPALLVTSLREIVHATKHLQDLADSAVKQAIREHGVRFTDIYRVDDDFLTTS